MWERCRPGEGLCIQVGKMAVELASVIRGVGFTVELVKMAVELVPEDVVREGVVGPRAPEQGVPTL